MEVVVILQFLRQITVGTAIVTAVLLGYGDNLTILNKGHPLLASLKWFYGCLTSQQGVGGKVQTLWFFKKNIFIYFGVLFH